MKSETACHLVVFPAIIAVTRGCDTASPNADREPTEPGKTTFELAAIQKLPSEEIKTAILRSLTKRNWIVTAQNGETITAERISRRTREEISVTYDTESISIENQSATDTPSKAIKALMNEIQKNLLDGFEDWHSGRKAAESSTTAQTERVQNDEAQAKAWNDALGEYMTETDAI